MDKTARGILLQLDDEMPGVRSNALEALREHLQKAGRKFRDLVADLENAVPPAKLEELETKLAEYIKANEKAQKRDAKQRAEIKTLKAALWVKTNWKIVVPAAAGLLVLVAGICAYE